MAKEEKAIILDYLPNGYPLEKKTMPIAQAVGVENLTLLELAPRRDTSLGIGEEVYIGEGKRDKIYYILGRLHREKITESAKIHLQEVIAEHVKNNEKEYLKFFNDSTAINKRIHQIELIPGMGKRHMREILDKREEAKFNSFEDMKLRITNLPDPAKAVEKRIFQEMTNVERHNLFTR